MLTTAAALRGATKHYKTFALGPVDLAVPAGSILGLIGENGAGKTTALKLLCGAIRPAGGSVELLGGSPADPAIRARIGVVFEDAYFPDCFNAACVGKSMAGIFGKRWGTAKFDALVRRFELDGSKKIKEYGSNAMVMTVTLFAVGIFMGVIKDSGMVEAMAETIVNALPAAIAPHMHWFMALFSVPLLMILGTDAFYYALLPIIIGVVQPFGITPETVAATFLLSATMATPISPSVAAVYVGLGLADVSISEHIRYSLRLVWPASIAVLILSTLVGVIQF